MSQIDQRPIKEIFPNAKDVINHAFTLDGVDYFEFNDFNSVPCERGFHALSFYNELSMRCTRDYLLAHVQATEDIINNNKGIKLTDIIKLNQQLKERLEMLFEPEIAYKLCSVVFFDASENPYRFSYKYALEKAEKFKEHQMEAFFLQKPIVKLIPYIGSWAKDFQEYCQMVTMINKAHLEAISTMLSEQSKSSESFKQLMLQNLKASV